MAKNWKYVNGSEFVLVADLFFNNFSHLNFV